MVGAAIAVKVGNPLLAVPLAFASHFVMEMVPHWNPHINTEFKKFGKVTKKSTTIIVIDSIFALLSGSFIAWQALPDQALALTILACCLASILPDLIEAPYFFLKFKSEAIKKWIVFQKSLQVDTTPFWGLLTQSVTILSVIWWLRS